MESLIVLAYVLTAFVWCGIDASRKRPTFKTFATFIGKFITFPYWVIKEKV